jgi:hypothetical protein
VFIELQQKVDKDFCVLFNLLEFLAAFHLGAGRLTWHTWPGSVSKEIYQVSKETYDSVKRELIVSHDTFPPGSVSKETYYSVQRDLRWCQNRPTIVSKET